MSEETLAAHLDQYLDALLAGDPLPQGLPPEVADLVELAVELTDLAPQPRPEFGPALKESLLAPPPPSGGGGASGGPPSGFNLPAGLPGLLAGSLILLVGLGLALFGLARSGDGSIPSPTALPAQTRPLPTTSSAAPFEEILPAATPSPTPAPTASAVPTPIVDPLPQATVGLQDLPTLPDLEPGLSDTSAGQDAGGAGSSNNDDDGDDNRGHGNDPDRHDEDNPGRGKKNGR